MLKLNFSDIKSTKKESYLEIIKDQAFSPGNFAYSDVFIIKSLYHGVFLKY